MTMIDDEMAARRVAMAELYQKVLRAPHRAQGGDIERLVVYANDIATSEQLRERRELQEMALAAARLALPHTKPGSVTQKRAVIIVGRCVGFLPADQREKNLIFAAQYDQQSMKDTPEHIIYASRAFFDAHHDAAPGDEQARVHGLRMYMVVVNLDDPDRFSPKERADMIAGAYRFLPEALKEEATKEWVSAARAIPFDAPDPHDDKKRMQHQTAAEQALRCAEWGSPLAYEAMNCYFKTRAWMDKARPPERPDAAPRGLPAARRAP